jgi:hypothetical protein
VENQPAAATPSEQDQKQVLGEQIYNHVLAIHSDETLAGKITGMLLESTTLADLSQLVASESFLDNKIQEAFKVLEDHRTKSEAAPTEASTPVVAAEAPATTTPATSTPTDAAPAPTATTTETH